ncbi:MAG: GtrA family protein [Gammaproteobacteria bacterium]|nr:GtrA family protein [Gammaproteobacteria bacterium]NND54807.1 GtrA family protein [Gammaproteobacteria bacterium]
MFRTLLNAMPDRLPGFLVVGTIGLVVDAAVLALLVYGFGWGNYSARGISFATALTTTWLLNREYVFSDGKLSSKRREYSRYLFLQFISMAVNLGVYSLCIALSEFMAAQPLVALAAGCASGLIFNYIGMRFFVFTGDPTESD